MRIQETIASKDILADLLGVCKQVLGINSFPEIELIDEPTVGTTSFGVFGDGRIVVATKGRHQVDIMRTIAHEVVHWHQAQRGDEMDGSDGSDCENEANSQAGVIMRHFGKKYPEYFLEVFAEGMVKNADLEGKYHTPKFGVLVSGKLWKKDGKPVEFLDKAKALSAADRITASRNIVTQVVPLKP